MSKADDDDTTTCFVPQPGKQLSKGATPLDHVANPLTSEELPSNKPSPRRWTRFEDLTWRAFRDPRTWDELYTFDAFRTHRDWNTQQLAHLLRAMERVAKSPNSPGEDSPAHAEIWNVQDGDDRDKHASWLVSETQILRSRSAKETAAHWSARDATEAAAYDMHARALLRRLQVSADDLAKELAEDVQAREKFWSAIEQAECEADKDLTAGRRTIWALSELSDTTLANEPAEELTSKWFYPGGWSVARNGVVSAPGAGSRRWFAASVDAEPVCVRECRMQHPTAPISVTESAPLIAKAPSGGLDYALKDAPLIAEMRRLVESEGHPNPYQAALAVAHKAAGKGEFQSKVARLLAKYKKASSAVQG